MLYSQQFSRSQKQSDNRLYEERFPEYNRNMFCLYDKKTAGFTLIELIVVISIAAIMMLFAIAPYNLYSDKARVRLSAERIEQAITKAKLFASTGYSVGDKNQDLVVSIEKGSEYIDLEYIPTL